MRCGAVCGVSSCLLLCCAVLCRVRTLLTCLGSVSVESLQARRHVAERCRGCQQGVTLSSLEEGKGFLTCIQLNLLSVCVFCFFDGIPQEEERELRHQRLEVTDGKPLPAKFVI